MVPQIVQQNITELYITIECNKLSLNTDTPIQTKGIMYNGSRTGSCV